MESRRIDMKTKTNDVKLFHMLNINTRIMIHYWKIYHNITGNIWTNLVLLIILMLLVSFYGVSIWFFLSYSFFLFLNPIYYCMHLIARITIGLPPSIPCNSSLSPCSCLSHRPGRVGGVLTSHHRRHRPGGVMIIGLSSHPPTTKPVKSLPHGLGQWYSGCNLMWP